MSLLKGKRKVPNIVRGGRAIPFGNPNDNLYYLQGRSHARGGIDIGTNPRTGIEAEGGEVVQIKPNELRVLSAQDFIGGGVSPAKQVLAGANPDKVFNNQERFKDRHRLNDDGTKYQDGGIIRPDPLTPEGKKYYARISGAANPINPEFDLATSFISVPKLITLGAKGSILGFRNGRIMDVLENASDKVDKFNNYINNNIIKGIKPIVNYIDKKVPDKYRKQYRNITKKIVETGLSNDYAKPIINGTVSTVRDNINEENNQKQNGGMITTINGNIKNGLIVTPRPKAKGGTGIHIKPSKRGTFTAAAKAHGKSVQGFASQVLANKDNYSSAMVKKANFARNASKWNHKACGGRKKAEDGLTTRDYNPATRGGMPVSAMSIDTLTSGLNPGVYTWNNYGDEIIRQLQTDDIKGNLEVDIPKETSREIIERIYPSTDLSRPSSDYVTDHNKIRGLEQYDEFMSNFTDTINSVFFPIKQSKNAWRKKIHPDAWARDLGKKEETNTNTSSTGGDTTSSTESNTTSTQSSNSKPTQSSNSTSNNRNNRTKDNTYSVTNYEIQSDGTLKANGNRTGQGFKQYNKRKNQRTITDARVSRPWRETIGSDADVLNYIANGDAFEHKRWQDRHSKMSQETGYDYSKRRAIQHEDVSGYSHDFNEKFNLANRKLGNYTTPAGRTGDNAQGERKKKFGGRRLAPNGTTTNLERPYEDDWYGAQVEMRQLGKNLSREDYKYLQEQIDTRRQSPLRRAAFERADGYVGVIDELATPEIKSVDVTAPKIDLSPISKTVVPQAHARAAKQDALNRAPLQKNWRDEIGLGLGVAGSIIDPILRGRQLRNLRSWTPYTESPVKLKTNYNINPQLDRIRESSQEAYRDIDANTASSSTALARKQRVRNQAQYAANEQWGLKENRETQLINQDKLNLQGVRNRNTTRLNQWAADDARIANQITMAKADNISNAIQNVVGVGLDYLGRKDFKDYVNNTKAAITAGAPNVDDRMLIANGLNLGDLYNTGIPTLATNTYRRGKFGSRIKTKRR